MLCVSGDSSRVDEFIAYCRSVKSYYLFMTKHYSSTTTKSNQISPSYRPFNHLWTEKTLGWNLIKFGLRGIQEISTMILTERFTCNNTERLLNPNYNSIVVTFQEVLSQWFYTLREQKHDVNEYFKIVIFPLSVITI